MAGQKLGFELKKLTIHTVDISDFDKLCIPFRAVATDLRTGELVVLGKGNLAEAMRASMSIPGVWPPVELEGIILVDGFLVSNVPAEIAKEMGYIKLAKGTQIPMEQVDNYPRNRITVIATGALGQESSSLMRIINQDHRHLRVLKGDSVIFSSSVIPGNENAVYRVINGLIKLGANVVHKGNAKVHTSGHASAGELLYCFNILKPRNVLPVHGEARHLRAAADLAIETGVEPKRTIIGDNGVVVDLKDGVAKVVGQLDIGFVYVDGSTVGEITDADLKDRRILAEEGFISIFIAIDTQTGTCIVGPEIQARGFAEDDSVFDGVRPQIVKALEEAAKSGTNDQHGYQQIVRRTVGRWVNTQHRRRPMIIPVVIEA